LSISIQTGLNSKSFVFSMQIGFFHARLTWL
jgi:hypothetical protein